MKRKLFNKAAARSAAAKVRKKPTFYTTIVLTPFLVRAGLGAGDVQILNLSYDEFPNEGAI
jgi:hypothetical protein